MTKRALFVISFLIILSPYCSAKLGYIVFDDKAASLKKAGMAPAVFPHGKHEEIYKCDDCHPKIFKNKRGGNDITMQKNISGEFCGTVYCHDSQKGFPLYFCNKCHVKKDKK